MLKRKLYKQIEKLNSTLSKTNVIELSYILGSKKEIFIRNIFAGISRGVGIGIGVTIITAIIIFFLNKLVKLNIPVIGDYIVDLVDIVEQNRKY